MLRRLVIGGIDFYRKGISPLRLPSCRYHPSCSAYAREAVERYGVLRGGWLFLRRFARCNPFGGHGHDPVPELPVRSSASARSSRAEFGSPPMPSPRDAPRP